MIVKELGDLPEKVVNVCYCELKVTEDMKKGAIVYPKLTLKE